MVAPVCDAGADENVRSRTLAQGSAGMILPAESDLHFGAGRIEAFRMLRSGTFTGLDTIDQQTLVHWLDGAIGIDTVMDLAVRPWNIAGANVIFGVFEADKDKASWLVVRHGSGWTLARCADGFVSDVSASLPDILSLIDKYRGYT